MRICRYSMLTRLPRIFLNCRGFATTLKVASNKKTLSKSQDKGLEAYERKTPLEHVLLRPGMYIGEIESKTVETWLYDAENKRMNKESVTYSPALIKIFDEILVNAADNFQRSKDMTTIAVTAEAVNNRLKISVYNDGKGIPVQKHPKEQIYIPELIFGNLLTGSNFNDDEKRLTGGRHGYGAKLTNIFSNSFKIETYDSSQQLLYKQIWTNNMTKMEPPEITTVTIDNTDHAIINTSSKPSKKTKTSKNVIPMKDFTRITFEPDLIKFHMIGNDIDTKAMLQQVLRLIYRRTLDITACVPGVKVTFNNHKINIDDFEDYIKLYSKRIIDSGNESSTTKTKENTDETSEIEEETTEYKAKVLYHRINTRWEIGITRSATNSFENMSFVNSVWTPDGGSHVTVITNQIINAFQEILVKKNIKDLHPSTIRNKLMIFVKADIENPSFDSQSKLSLSSKPSSFGSDYTIPATILKSIVDKSGILSELVAEAKFREEYKLSKALSSSKSGKRQIAGSLSDIPKLEDAHYAGSVQHALNCTLILTEGDSAKALAIAGLEIVGRDYYGVLPLRGKILNVRQANIDQMRKNEELSNICKSLGLNFNQTYEDGLQNKGLRYGKVLLMCDQDHDGSHIKGLVINFFQHFWPYLLNHMGFLQQFITPLVKATPLTTMKLSTSSSSSSSSTSSSSTSTTATTKRSKNKWTSSNTSNSATSSILSFYSMQEYMEWRKSVYVPSTTDSTVDDILDAEYNSTDSGSTSNNNSNISTGGGGSQGKGTNASTTTSSSSTTSKPMKYKIKYYKGLGTNTSEEGKEYFRSLQKHLKTFKMVQGDEEYIDLAFSKSRANDRRQWLASTYNANDYIDPLLKVISYGDFINKELIQFSHSDNLRSIPSIIDGLKPSQRKILYACFKKHLIQDMKVVQLAGYVAEHTAYHHGETSLHAAIVNMAQDYVGSNNVPLLIPSGQFGTRYQGGTDFASPRYIFTRLAPMTRLLFPPEDDAHLEYLEEDGVTVEPKHFLPIIPTLLMNGSQGIGTGWSTIIPSYNPIQITEYIIQRLKNPSYTNNTLHPWIRGFKGKIELSGNQYITTGILKLLSDKTIEILELPYGKWTADYKEFLCELHTIGMIKKFSENHTTTSVHFKIIPTPQFIEKEGKILSQNELEHIFKLKSTINITNMVAFNAKNQLIRYENIYDIIHEYMEVRMQGYVTRKSYLLKKLMKDSLIYKNKSQFISQIISGELEIFSFINRKNTRTSKSTSTQSSSENTDDTTTSTTNSHSKKGLNECELVDMLQQHQFLSWSEIEYQSEHHPYTTTGSTTSLSSLPSSSKTATSVSKSKDSKQTTVKDKTSPVVSQEVTQKKDTYTLSDYAYLVEMPIHSLTESKYDILIQQATTAELKLQTLLKKTPGDLWQEDLEKLLTQLKLELI